ncbi:MAG TPA: O-antigen ligase family protein [Oligoflexus sp.]|uniref:O-antigen ligase family protein n=1 Tax=Oligoflexus sp. TaxID=1971216 RepID=UPI002D7FB6D2|nr:O-antigen ligase family protein [Oligoflexus sp.]HET9237218.1 O-antigen ligase family protein [Oligoflexus sp.]
MLVGLFLGLLLSSTLGFFPGLQDPYIPARLIGLLALTGAACLAIIFDRTLRERLRELTVLLGVIVGWSILQVALDLLRSGAGSTSMGISRDITLICVSFLSLHLLKKEENFLYTLGWLNTLLAVNIAGLGLGQLAGASLPWFPSSGLGPETLTNINVIAQYLGFSLALGLYLLSREKDFLPRAILILACGCMLAYPLLIVCRSVLIGVCLLLAFAIISQRLQGKEAIAIVLATALFSFFIARPVLKQFEGSKPHFVNSATQATDAAILNQTFGSMSGRIFLWQRTMDMIKDRPWLGFGRGSYELASSAYVLKDASPFRSESRVVDNPQNELLRLCSELGLPLGAALVLGFLGLLAKALAAAHRFGDPEDRAVLAANLGFILLTESIFQFPLMMPVGIIFFALLISLLCSLLPPLRLRALPLPWARMGMGIVALLLMLQASRLAWAEYAASHPTMASRDVERACKLMPEHWRVCLRYSKELMDAGRWQEAAALNMRRLEKYPGFHPSERVAALSAWNQGHIADACALAKRYQQQFLGQSSLEFISKHCEDIMRD